MDMITYFKHNQIVFTTFILSFGQAAVLFPSMVALVQLNKNYPIIYYAGCLMLFVIVLAYGYKDANSSIKSSGT